MNHRFDIELNGKAVNEQWHDDAKMFVEAAEEALLHPTNQPWLKAYNCARLHEYAEQAYHKASSRSIGHNRSERYDEQARLCRKAHELRYAEASKLWEEMIAQN